MDHQIGIGLIAFGVIMLIVFLMADNADKH
jgi:hypothetical protein